MRAAPLLHLPAAHCRTALARRRRHHRRLPAVRLLHKPASQLSQHTVSQPRACLVGRRELPRRDVFAVLDRPSPGPHHAAAQRAIDEITAALQPTELRLEQVRRPGMYGWRRACKLLTFGPIRDRLPRPPTSTRRACRARRASRPRRRRRPAHQPRVKRVRHSTPCEQLALLSAV